MAYDAIGIFGGREFLEREYPSVLSAFDAPKKTNADGEAANPLGDDAQDNYGGINALMPDGTGVSTIHCGDFLEQKPLIASGVVLTDQKTGLPIESFYSYEENTHFIAETYRANGKGAVAANTDTLTADATLVWVNPDGTSGTKNQQMTVGNYYDGLPIIASTTVTKPRAQDRKLTIVLYDRDSQGEKPDYVYTNVKIDDSHVRVKMPFQGNVVVDSGWTLNRVCDAFPYPPRLTLMLENGGVVDYANAQGFVPQFKVQGNTASWDFNDDWNKILDLSRFSVSTILDFHCSFALEVKKGSTLMYPIITVNSSNEAAANESSAIIEKISIRWGCVAEGTLISMADGSTRKAEDVRVGDSLKSQDGESVAVTNVFMGTEAELVRLKTASGECLDMTYDHPVLAARGFVRADELTAGDRIVTESGESAVSELYPIPYGGKVYSVETSPPGAIVCNGIVTGDFVTQNSRRSDDAATVSSDAAIALKSEMKGLIDRLRERQSSVRSQST